MKVALISWAPFYAGAEVAALRLAMGLREAGEEVVCVVGTEGELLAKLQAEQFRTYYVPTRFTDKWKWLSYRRSRNELVRILQVELPDIVHSNDLPTHQMASDAARRVGVPRICHHRWIFEGAAIDWLNKFGAERHLFVSMALMNELRGNSPRLAAAPCSVAHDGLPLPPCPSEQDRMQARQLLGLAPDRLLLLFAGQIIERKGVADVLHAWHQLAPRWRDQADLVVVGDDLEGQGAYRAKMVALAAELGSSPRFVGFQKNVPTWLTAADIVLVPSHAEPLGNATLEAMAHARPVIGGNVGGIPEMVVAEETGLLVPPKSPAQLAGAMDRLLSNDDLRSQLGSAARRRCEERFSLSAHVQTLRRQYATLVLPATVGVPA